MRRSGFGETSENIGYIWKRRILRTLQWKDIIADVVVGIRHILFPPFFPFTSLIITFQKKCSYSVDCPKVPKI